MRSVSRRCTSKRATRTSPWSKRPSWPTGAPRVCLTNLRTPIVVPVGAESFIALGEFDSLLRLYQHRGSSTREHVRYRIEEEWNLLQDMGVEWLELFDDELESVLRIDFRSALRYGSKEPSSLGPVWSIPLAQFTRSPPEDRYINEVSSA
jgi:hypothetical protein